MRSSSIFAAAVILATLSGAANAAIVVYNFGLDGLQEVPSNASPGIGSATVTLDTVSGAVTVTGTYSGMVGSVTAAHIHGLAPVGVNAGILIHLTHTGGTSGTLGGGGVLSAANIQGMLDELTYINVHTTFLPGGEIRGQIVPTPASLALMGLGGLAGLRRRR